MNLCKKVLLIAMSVLFVSSSTPHVSAEKPIYLTDDELWAITTKAGDLYDLSASLLFALVESESSKNVYAENGSHKGLCQISTKWHKDRMEELGVEDVYDPYGNVLTCADYLTELLEIAKKRKCKLPTEYALMRYNMATTTANEMYANGEISKYAKRIVSRAQELESEEKTWREKEEIKEALMKIAEKENESTKDVLMPRGGIAHLYPTVLR